MMNQLKIVKCCQEAKIPTRATPKSAGLDLFSCEYANIEPGERKLVNTGIKIVLPENTYGRVAPRSGLSLKNCIDIQGKIKN